ncbi:type ISP restriction/modification enzyme [Streptacidiphilus rugosus]|uniref:type ISP restriction/modification enzyme n=1 Tax=Streptacidiphilus rugosus TaxID=405783 RepID=UPI00068CB232|nr:type ISP restriction/modification enzyme [Streptacidiphilus rugosus]
MADSGGELAPTALAELMPWAVRGIRAGRSWVLAADPEVLEERWRRLAAAAPAQRAELFETSRSRTPDTAVAALPGQAGGASTRRLSREPGPRPPLVRVRHRPLDRAWLLADQRLLDQARPELWRAAGPRQRYLLVQPVLASAPADAAGPAATVAGELPVDHRVTAHPLHRRPEGGEPNLTPGLLPFLSSTFATRVGAEDVLAWAAAVTTRPDAPRRPDGSPLVPLPRSVATWEEGVSLGHRLVELHTFARAGLRLPDGRRSFIRQAVDRQPDGLDYDAETETLLLGEGRLAPVSPAAGRSPALREWFAERTAFRTAPSGTLQALGLTSWPQRASTELIELASTLAHLAELRPLQEALAADGGPWLGREELHTAGVLPVLPAARRPASVFGASEEGPEGQYALL